MDTWNWGHLELAMHPVATLVVSSLLMLLAGGLILSHLRTYRADLGTVNSDSETVRYTRQRFRRRMQASIMIGITGVAILCGQWLPPRPLLFAWYWLAVVVWVLWISLLAVFDMVASNRYYRNLQHDQAVEQAKLRAELERIERQDNGHAKKTRPRK